MNTCFEWDAAKAAGNLRKHGVSFETAARVFADPYAWVAPNRIENGEQRWLAIGAVDGQLILIVAHTIREREDGDEIIRIISARRANRAERRRYEEENCEP